MQKLEKISELDIKKDLKQYEELTKEYSDLSTIVELFNTWQQNKIEIENNNQMLDQETEKELIDFIKDEISTLNEEQDALEKEIKLELLPKNPDDDKKSAYLEIRQGTKEMKHPYSQQIYTECIVSFVK